MASLVTVLEAVGSFLLGTAGRLGLFLAAGVVLLVPAVLLALAWRGLAGLRGAPRAVRRDARLAPGHTWLAPRDRRGTLAVGLDEVAERILPSATALELPAPGMQVHRGDPIAVIRAGRRAIRIGAPVDGTIVGVNPRVRRNPGLVKEDPYGRGWLFLIQPRDDGWTRLPSGAAADAWVAAERRRLARFVEEELGLAAADGGELLAPAPALLGEEGWRRVVAAFLRAA
jgi:glycine cleavage system H lipoate-binding protein